MSSRNGRKSFHAELPVEVLDAVKEEAKKTGKPMWEVFNDSARMFLGLDEVSTEASVQRHIERLNSEIDTLVQEKEAIESQIETKQDRLEGYNRKLESIQDQKESYETRLDDILDDLEANKKWKVIARHATIKELATDKYGQPTSENMDNVIDDLWDRAMDQQREVARYQFSDSTTGRPQRAVTDGSGTGSDDDLATKYDFSKANYDLDDDSDDTDDDDEAVLMTDGGVDMHPAGGGETLTDQILQFYRTYCREDIGQLAVVYPEEQSLVVDWTDVFKWHPDVADDILNNEPQIREYFEEALRMFDIPADISLDNANVRFENVGEENRLHVDQLRSNNIGNYREIIGQIKQRTGAKPVVTDAAFECQRCGVMNYIPQSDGDFQEPHDCAGCEREGPWELNFNESEFKDFERLRLVEPPERTQGADGQHVDVSVDCDLVDSANPGDRIRVAGVITAEQPEDGSDGMFDYEIEGRAIEHTQETFSELELDAETVEQIKHIATSGEFDPYAVITNSIAPGHHGDEDIKLSIGLQLFRGVRGELPDGSHERGDIHILLMGDPGTGKSTLLGAAEDIAPRSASASGKGASKAGLTAAALPSDFSANGMTLEAGALVLADKGLAAIDEIDKIPDEVSSAMHGAMSKQRVEINKGGFSNVALPSRTAVLAAGNPKFGRFDPYEPTNQQLELPGALMDRFDLIWTLKDDLQPERDEAVASHILDTVDVATRNVSGVEADADAVEAITADVDQDFLRHWIAYARKNHHPTLNQDVKDRIRAFWIELRSAGYGNEESPVPVTKRKLEGLTRLAQASARVRLADEVTIEDAKRACDLMLKSMHQVGVDPETGQFDADVVETGMSKTQRDRIKTVKRIISDIEKQHEDGAPIDEILEVCAEVDIPEEKVNSQIEELREQGDVYEPSADRFRVTE